jgi:hypothetical protein
MNADVMFIFFKRIFYFFILVAMFVVYEHNIINGVILEIGILKCNFLGCKFEYSIRVCFN